MVCCVSHWCRCISMNSHFIFGMLQVFEPPFDMSQDIEFSEDPHPECAEKDHLVSEGINACSCESVPEVDIESRHQSNTGSLSPGLINTKGTTEYCSGSSITDSNGNVPITSSQQQWLEPSLRLNVPLVDVDKGKKERDQCYNPILEELNMIFPNRSKESPPACLVPGAGLGRLALEISCLGAYVLPGLHGNYD
ncbi:hypothetical protein V8G54_034058 [Vigna mungo]|uniref:Uncharacterized protein n=1 Tax=Vigna mungo TaxID=3915 RepID=A0AAQ3MQ13_VIGMU